MRKLKQKITYLLWKLGETKRQNNPISCMLYVLESFDLFYCSVLMAFFLSSYDKLICNHVIQSLNILLKDLLWYNYFPRKYTWELCAFFSYTTGNTSRELTHNWCPCLDIIFYEHYSDKNRLLHFFTVISVILCISLYIVYSVSNLLDYVSCTYEFM
jgi:hypothetical protein